MLPYDPRKVKLKHRTVLTERAQMSDCQLAQIAFPLSIIYNSSELHVA